MDAPAERIIPEESTASKKPWVEPECEMVDIAHNTAGPLSSGTFDGYSLYS
jgi:hypothetical protein